MGFCATPVGPGKTPSICCAPLQMMVRIDMSYFWCPRRRSLDAQRILLRVSISLSSLPIVTRKLTGTFQWTCHFLLYSSIVHEKKEEKRFSLRTKLAQASVVVNCQYEAIQI